MLRVRDLEAYLMNKSYVMPLFWQSRKRVIDARDGRQPGERGDDERRQPVERTRGPGRRAVHARHSASSPPPSRGAVAGAVSGDSPRMRP